MAKSSTDSGQERVGSCKGFGPCSQIGLLPWIGQVPSLGRTVVYAPLDDVEPERVDDEPALLCGRFFASSPACSLSICLLFELSTLNVTVSPTAKLDSAASPLLSMSLLVVTEYLVVPFDVLMVTVFVPTAVSVPVRPRPPPSPRPWCSCASGTPSAPLSPG